MRVRVPQPRGLLGASAVLGLEAAWLGARIAGYPLGLRPERPRRNADPYRTSDLKPHQRGLIGAGDVPVLLVHGLVDNRSVFGVLQRQLRRKGFRHVATMNYPILTGDVRSAAALLAEQVESLCGETGADRVHVVGHSLGGIIGRWYVQQMGGDERVDTLVTLGSPHAGTTAAKILPISIVRQLRPGSDVLRALAAPAPGCRTRVLSLWSDRDEMMLPRDCARLDHGDLDVRNVQLSGVGHVAMTIHPRVVTEITLALAAPTHEAREPSPPPSRIGAAHPSEGARARHRGGTGTRRQSFSSGA
ncbi:MAG: esterase/lipase family protein [Mycobacteriales bacterium]